MHEKFETNMFHVKRMRIPTYVPWNELYRLSAPDAFLLFLEKGRKKVM